MRPQWLVHPAFEVMKTLLKSHILTFSLLWGTLAFGQDESDSPLGNISTDAIAYAENQHPKLTWNITYPQLVQEIVEIEDDGTIIPKADVTMQVRVLAADVQERKISYDRWGNQKISLRYIDVVGYARVNYGYWYYIFGGTQPEVDPNEVVFEQELMEGEEVYFASRAVYSGLGYYYSGQDDPNVIVLQNGDTPPTYTTWDSQETLGTHIEAYLDDDGNVDIGPRDVIVAFELTHVLDPNSNNNDGDVQDFIVLLTFQ